MSDVKLSKAAQAEIEQANIKVAALETQLTAEKQRATLLQAIAAGAMSELLKAINGNKKLMKAAAKEGATVPLNTWGIVPRADLGITVKAVPESNVVLVSVG